MSNFKNLAVASVVTLLGALAVAGCGEKVINADEMTANIEKQFEQQTGTKLTSIECDKVKAEVGEAISCDAANENDMKLEITGKVTGDEGDGEKWGFDWKVTRALAPGKAFEDSASAVVAKKFGVSVESVSCPDRIEVKEGNEIKCEATATDGSTRGLTLRLTDDEGGFRVTVDKG